VADLLAGIPGIEIHLTGGQLLERQSVLLGSTVLLVLGRWRFDLAFLSVEGFTREGLWNTSPEVVAMQKMAARRARKTFILADASKQGHNAPAFLFPWKRVNGLLTETASKELIRWKVPTFP
jgi:DeoR/GlpR family transcriptional regulator of sugar metabolism